MKITRSNIATTGFIGLALALTFALIQAPAALGQQPAAKAAPKAAPVPPDPRVQQRTYHFADTNENLPYALYVSSKVAKNKKNPLIVALHGLGSDHNRLMHDQVIDLAEQGGYIVVAPIGYNPRGWYGTPVGAPRTGKAKVQRAPDPAAANDPPNLRQLSEKDVMNVLDLIRKEFNVDEKRTYLMGHSMGGAGTLYIGTKYASNWAAIAAIAPAAFAMQANAAAILDPVKKTMPVIVVQGDADTAVPVANTRAWIEVMKQLNMNYKYVEIPGGDHGSVIWDGMPAIFAFFKEHPKH